MGKHHRDQDNIDGTKKSQPPPPPPPPSKPKQWIDPTTYEEVRTEGAQKNA